MLMSASVIMETVLMIVSTQKLVIIVSVLLDISFKLTSMIVKVNKYIASSTLSNSLSFLS